MFGLDGLSSRALQKYYYQRYGTTLAGLIREYDVSPAEFLHFVHDIDRSSLAPNPALAGAIEALPGRKLVLTNGSHAHALATAKQLGIDHLFEDFFAIEHADYLPKPALQTFTRFFERHSVDPAKSAMFEDIVHNLEAPHASGMLTVLVRPLLGAADHRDDWEKSLEKPVHVDFITDDLEGFLRRLTAPA
jgi:putative hydrolase of the HAD superfamily